MTKMTFWQFYYYIVYEHPCSAKEKEGQMIMAVTPIITIPWLYYKWLTEYKNW